MDNKNTKFIDTQNNNTMIDIHPLNQYNDKRSIRFQFVSLDNFQQQTAKATSSVRKHNFLVAYTT